MASRSLRTGSCSLLAVTALLVAFAPSEVRAQTAAPQIALDQFQAAPSGDDFFAIQGYRAGTGKVDYSGMILGEYARNPLVLYNLDAAGKTSTQRGAVVSDQLYMHVGVSVGFFERVQLSLDLPIALLNQGGSPVGTAFQSPSGAALGDLRAGLRLRLIGERKSAFGAALTGYAWFPTGDDTNYSGDGKVRGSPGLALGGCLGPILWGLNGGALFRRGSAQPNLLPSGTSVTFGGGVAAVLLDDKLQIGPELYGASIVANGDTSALSAFDRKNTNLEGIFGLKGRIGPVVLGGGAGPGFTSGPGTPSLRAVVSIAYAPIEDDRDHDGVLDKDDACPDVPGVRTSDPKTNGCPPSDRDHDGIVDADDACPDDPGKKTDDPKTNGCPDKDGDGIFDKVDACPDVKGIADPDPAKNGCPPPGDRDKDGIIDPADACPDVPGVADPDPTKNGCPPDRDGDGIFDKDDACPDVKGVANADPAKNGCPPDTDGDGITDDKDACPTEPGKPDPDPKKNGCPQVFVKAGKIEILEQVQFRTGSDVILPASDALLTNVAGVFVNHPEITKVLVEGHTDNKGTKLTNKLLSERRAASVKKWLIKHGVEASRLDSKGFGQEVPIGDNATDEGRQKNRRVEFKILETGKPGEVLPAVSSAPVKEVAPAPPKAPKK